MSPSTNQDQSAQPTGCYAPISIPSLSASHQQTSTTETDLPSASISPTTATITMSNSASLSPRPPRHDPNTPQRSHRQHSTSRVNPGQEKPPPTLASKEQAATVAVQRVLNSTRLGSADAEARFSQQLRYRENIYLIYLKPHSSSLSKIFLDILRIKRDVPAAGRFHLLYESQHSLSPSGDVTSIDFFSLFSQTICGDTAEHRETARELGQLPVDFNSFSPQNASASTAAPAEAPPIPSLIHHNKCTSPGSTSAVRNRHSTQQNQ